MSSQPLPGSEQVMMMEADQTTAPKSDGPGKLLAKTRIGLGLSIKDIASDLRLAPRQIEALEADDYERLPGATYVRGYLRNYAKLLGLPAEQVLATRGSVDVEAEDNRALSPPVARQMRSGDRLIKFVTYGLTAVMIGLVVVWWQGRQELQGTGLGEAAVPMEPAARVAGSPAGDRPVVSPSGGETVAALATAGRRGETGTERFAASMEGVVGDAVAQPKKIVAGTAENLGADPPAAGLARLVLRYSEDCWTDIRDARQERLLYRTVPAGEVQVVEGVPPFTVFFGNAQGVQLEYNGKAYDFSSHVVGVFARFTLGGKASGR